jgi:hypothetical protein
LPNGGVTNPGPYDVEIDGKVRQGFGPFNEQPGQTQALRARQANEGQCPIPCLKRRPALVSLNQALADAVAVNDIKCWIESAKFLAKDALKSQLLLNPRLFKLREQAGVFPPFRFCIGMNT